MRYRCLSISHLSSFLTLHFHYKPSPLIFSKPALQSLPSHLQTRLITNTKLRLRLTLCSTTRLSFAQSSLPLPHPLLYQILLRKYPSGFSTSSYRDADIYTFLPIDRVHQLSFKKEVSSPASVESSAISSLPPRSLAPLLLLSELLLLLDLHSFQLLSQLHSLWPRWLQRILQLLPHKSKLLLKRKQRSQRRMLLWLPLSMEPPPLPLLLKPEDIIYLVSGFGLLKPPYVYESDCLMLVLP